METSFTDGRNRAQEFGLSLSLCRFCKRWKISSHPSEGGPGHLGGNAPTIGQGGSNGRADRGEGSGVWGPGPKAWLTWVALSHLSEARGFLPALVVLIGAF